MSSTKFYVLVGTLTIQTLILLSLILTAEYAYRSFKADDSTSNPWKLFDQFYYPKPYVMSSADPIGFGINEEGYRSDLWHYEKPEGERRVFVFGGSTVFNGNPSFTEAMDKHFASYGVRFFNLGISGSNSTQDIVRLFVEVLQHAPDHLIFYGPVNDLHTIESRLGFPHRFAAHENNPIWGGSIKNFPLWQILLFKSEFLRDKFPSYFEKAFLKSKRFGHLETLDEIARIENLVSNMKKVKLLSDALRIKFTYIVQPTVFTKTILHENEKPFFSEGAKVIAVRNNHDVIKRLNEAKIETIDLTDVFSSYHEQLFVDFIHINDEGQSRLNAKMINLFSRTLKDIQ